MNDAATLGAPARSDAAGASGKSADTAGPLLQVRNLQVRLDARTPFSPVCDLSFDLAAGQTLALVGESGCGKSMTALAINRLLPDIGRVAGGSVRLGGVDLFGLSESRMRAVRGGQIGMIFQEPGTSLNPVLSVRTQLTEVLRRHRRLSGQAAADEAVRLLDAVGIADAARQLDRYPFQFSGGMKQRVMIAQALAGDPQLLIADEPTTALDVTIQAQVLDLLARLQRERGMAMLLITHDLGVVARMADRVGVMYAGELVELADRAAFFAAPRHPYSQSLFAALPERSTAGGRLQALAGTVPDLAAPPSGCRFAPRCDRVMPHCHHQPPGWHRDADGAAVRCHLHAPTAVDGRNPSGGHHAVAATAARGGTQGDATVPVFEVRGLDVRFPVRRGVLQRVVAQVPAVSAVDLCLMPGRTLALVGESGCGKTTAGKALLQLVPAACGEFRLDGQPLALDRPAVLQQLRRQIQMVFQDPFASLDPRMAVGEIIEEGMVALGVGRDAADRHTTITALLARMGLSADAIGRFPHEFSGGQRQRIAIARALAVSPRMLVCDEPTSALDVSVQAQLLNLFAELQAELGLSYLFISHNLSVVAHLAHDVAVMYLGRIVEHGPAARVLNQPAHPYTRLLLDAVPRIEAGRAVAASQATDPDVARRPTDLPSPLAPPPGCAFAPRCPRVQSACREAVPALETRSEGHRVRCLFPLDGNLASDLLR